MLLALNRKASLFVERHLPFARYLEPAYHDRVLTLIGARSQPRILDVGAGKQLSFDRKTVSEHRPYVIALDIDPAEIALNQEADEKIVADASKEIPLESESIDVLISRTVMEHLPDVDRFLSEAARVLRPGGAMLHYFPARWAPFAIINRVLPHHFGRRLLFILRPESRRVGGFRAYYDKCSVPAFTEALKRHGLFVNDLTTSYYQSIYYSFFFPAYLVSAVYDGLLWATGSKVLASFVLIEAEKPMKNEIRGPQALL